MSPVPRVQAWLSARPLVPDGIVAVILMAHALTAATVIGEDGSRDLDPFGVALIAAATLPLTLRRRNALAVYLAVTAAFVLYEAIGYPETPTYVGMMFALFSVPLHQGRREALIALGVALVVFTVAFFKSEELSATDTAANATVFVTAWLVGDNLRQRRERLGTLEERARLAEQEREEEARRAVAEERRRIARELHDVVAHSVSVMVVLAGGARRVAERDPQRAAEALASIEATGRESLQELRRLLGVLREEGEGASELTPQPGVGHLDALVAQTRDAGLPVEVIVEGEPRPLAPGIDLTAYRIVQEALTNSLKHAGPARATVRLRFDAGALELIIDDNGRGAAATQNGEGAGHGLVGMAERVRLFGGQLRVGPGPGGGFRVQARLPLELEAKA